MSTDTPISEDIALRIALAARALPDTEPQRLLEVLDSAVGLPPTETALAGLTVKQLRTAADGELADLDASFLRTALAFLKGEASGETVPPPPVEVEASDTLASSIRVACASDGGESLDGHFGSCRRFLVYQVWGEGHRLIDVREVDNAKAKAAGDKNAYRTGLIADCQVLYVTSIGAPAAAKVVKAEIHPVRLPAGGNARGHIAALQRVLADKPPPWLAKAIGRTPVLRAGSALEASQA